MPDTEVHRLMNEYARRDQKMLNLSIYSFSNPAYLFMLHQREKTIIQQLTTENKNTLDQQQILEIGCGAGGVLLDFLRLGAKPHNLIGIDLLHYRLQAANQLLPGSHFLNCDGQRLPVISDKFDLLLQFTAFSSILESEIKKNMAAEMLRVLKPDGLILWYDFWWNPTNLQTAGIKPKELRELFPGCEFRFKKITLAPPIARLVVPISWSFALLLESLKIFNSHYMAMIKKKN